MDHTSIKLFLHYTRYSYVLLFLFSLDIINFIWLWAGEKRLKWMKNVQKEGEEDWFDKLCMTFSLFFLLLLLPVLGSESYVKDYSEGELRKKSSKSSQVKSWVSDCLLSLSITCLSYIFISLYYERLTRSIENAAAAKAQHSK